MFKKMSVLGACSARNGNNLPDWLRAGILVRFGKFMNEDVFYGIIFPPKRGIS